MKTTATSMICLPVAAMILTAALSVPAAAQTQMPFKGTLQGNDAVARPTITTAATGIGILVGQFSCTTVSTLTSAFGGTGTGHWIAANGDTMDTTFVGSADMSTGSLGYVTVTEIHTITSGTGQFDGAQGSFTVQRTHIEAPSDDGTHATFGSFSGAITLPPIAH